MPEEKRDERAGLDLSDRIDGWEKWKRDTERQTDWTEDQRHAWRVFWICFVVIAMGIVLAGASEMRRLVHG